MEMPGIVCLAVFDFLPPGDLMLISPFATSQTFPMNTQDREPFVGARTELLVFQIPIVFKTFHSFSGMSRSKIFFFY